MLWGSLTNSLSWKGLSCLLILLFTAQFIWTIGVGDVATTFTGRTQDSSRKVTSFTNGSSETLTAQQCSGLYPDLYQGIDHAVAFWKDKRHSISAQDTGISWRQDAAARILIHNNELRILETKAVHGNAGYRHRTLSVLSMLQRALWSASAVGEHLPTIEASIVVDDMSLLNGDPATDTRSIWTFASNVHDANHKRHWLIPNFSLYSAPATGSFEDMRRLAQQHNGTFPEKIPKIVWRGVKWTNEPLRGALLNASEGREWADVAVVNWKTGANIMPMDDNCAYAFTVHTEGRSYSGRLPFLLNCESLPLIHDLDWSTHFSHLLIAKGSKQNYVSVRRDFSDLESTVRHYLDRPQEAQRIIENTVNTFRDKYTTSAATSCYLRRLIAGYASVSFTPETTRPHARGSVTRSRGVSFEEFVHLDHDYPGDEGNPSSSDP